MDQIWNFYAMRILPGHLWFCFAKKIVLYVLLRWLFIVPIPSWTIKSFVMHSHRVHLCSVASKCNTIYYKDSAVTGITISASTYIQFWYLKLIQIGRDGEQVTSSPSESTRIQRKVDNKNEHKRLVTSPNHRTYMEKYDEHLTSMLWLFLSILT